MAETLQNKEAFEYYYSLGEHRSIVAVACQFNVSERTVARWSKAFNWQERVVQRDIENSKALEKKTNTTVVNEKANYRRIIKDAIQGIGEIKIESAKDLETIVKLDLLLMGEATEKSETEAKVDFSRLTTEQIRELLKNEDKG